MAVTIAEPIIEIVDTNNVTTYAFGSFTPTAGNILVVLAIVRGTVAAGSMVNTSGTALQWNKITSATFNAGADTLYAFWAKVPTSPAASVYTVDVTGDAGTACIAYMFSIAGANADCVNPIRQFKTASGASTNPASGALTLPILTESGVCAAWAGGLSSTNPANVSTPPASWTEIGDNGLATPTTNASGAYRATGETGSSVTFTAATTTWGLIFVEVWDAASGPEDAAFVGGNYYGYP